MIARAPAFVESLTFVDLDDPAPADVVSYPDAIAGMHEALAVWLARLCHEVRVQKDAAGSFRWYRLGINGRRCG